MEIIRNHQVDVLMHRVHLFQSGCEVILILQMIHLTSSITLRTSLMRLEAARPARRLILAHRKMTACLLWPQNVKSTNAAPRDTHGNEQRSTGRYSHHVFMVDDTQWQPYTIVCGIIMCNNINLVKTLCVICLGTSVNILTTIT